MESGPSAAIGLTAPVSGPPDEVFARVAGEAGAVFLDSALGGNDAESWVAWDPEDVVTGGIADLERVRSWLRDGCPEGGAAVGYVTYEGEAVFGLYPRVMRYRHGEGRWESGPGGWPEGGRTEGRFRAASPAAALRWAGEMTGPDYEARVRRAQEYIAAGDIYQVNLAHAVSAPWPEGVSAYPLYRCLREASPAPFGAFLRLGGRQILSSSPEEFLAIRGREIRTRPIKGTRPRHPDPDRDRGNAAELRDSAKERAELVMITDLERNDLGRICEFGSVRVEELAALESFRQVYHLVSTVRGRLRPDVDAVAALQACFPGGSITGAPKRRAMEIIAELEPSRRGLYTGAIGWFGADGGARFSIAIRTAVVSGGRIEFRVGAGIVADSDPAAEYRETLDKAAGFRAAVAAWEKREESIAAGHGASNVEVPDGFRPEVLRVS
jgi:aminodeoxychorismate synthase component I